MVILIIHLIPSVHWKDELAKLSGIPTDLINVLGTVMDEVCMVGTRHFHLKKYVSLYFYDF
jgi:aminoglycoside phosphotransferase family enzyme